MLIGLILIFINNIHINSYVVSLDKTFYVTKQENVDIEIYQVLGLRIRSETFVLHFHE